MISSTAVTSILARGSKLHAKLKGLDGKWKRVATPFSVGEEDRAKAWARDQQRWLDSERARRERAGGGPLTVRTFASRWLDARATKTVSDDRTRIEKHVLPHIGHMLLVDVRPWHIRDLVMELRKTALAPKTIREIASITSTMFKDAVFEQLIQTTPAIFKKGMLPKKQDKDPAWRAQAIFTRAEIEQIISDDRIPEDRRVIYALKFFCGRHTEVLSSTWERYDATTDPLGTLHVVETKTGYARAIPVHPTLAKILAAWKLGGWERTYGSRPTSTDLIVRTRRAGNVYAAADTQLRFVEDLAKLGLRTKASTRNRRGHDLRRTLITLARADGAIDSLLRWVTHGPRPSEILDVYSSPPWADLCREIAKLRVRLIEGAVVALPPSDTGALGTGVVQPSEVSVTANENERPRRDSNPSERARGAT